MDLLDFKDFQKYKRFLADQIVEISDNHLWCQEKSCEGVITLTDKKSKLGLISVHCKNCEDRNVETDFCIKCKFKACCPIACLHITCPKCRHEWCWLCQGPWSKHGGSYYQCNSYKPKMNKVKREAEKI